MGVHSRSGARCIRRRRPRRCALRALLHRPCVLHVHASQLYEGLLEGLVLFVILWIYTSKPRPRLAPAGLFLICYGIFRFAVEFVRVPDEDRGYLLFDWVTMGQILSTPMIIAGVAPVVSPIAAGSRAATLPRRAQRDCGADATHARHASVSRSPAPCPRHGVRKDRSHRTGTLSVFGHQMRFDLAQGFPLLTTKKLHLRRSCTNCCGFCGATPTSGICGIMASRSGTSGPTRTANSDHLRPAMALVADAGRQSSIRSAAPST